MPGVKYERDSVDKAECTFQGEGQTAAFLSHRSVELSIRQQVSSDLAFRKFFEILFTALHQASRTVMGIDESYSASFLQAEKRSM